MIKERQCLIEIKKFIIDHKGNENFDKNGMLDAILHLIDDNLLNKNPVGHLKDKKNFVIKDIKDGKMSIQKIAEKYGVSYQAIQYYNKNYIAKG